RLAARQADGWRPVRRRDADPRATGFGICDRVDVAARVGSASALPVRRGEAVSYEKRAALVIGGLGFIGGRLASALADEGATVTIITPSRQKHHEAAIELEARGIRILEGDVRDRGQMEAAVRGQDVIFNLAGQSGAVRSMEEPWDDLDVNARG